MENIKAIFIGLALFVFILLGFYLITNMKSFDAKSNDCASQGGVCVAAAEGCRSQGMTTQPEGICYDVIDGKQIPDGSQVCCLRSYV